MLRIATRRSALARAQAFQAARLIARRAGADFELVPMATTGDEHPEQAVDRFDTKGLFVDSLRRALLDGRVDLAIHSYKDLPTEEVPGLTIGGVPAREDPRDVLVSRDGYALATLPALATVGTSSERRRLQLLRTKPALQVLPVRGNLDTRLRKVAEGELDAVVVAFAGLRRLYAPKEAGGAGPLGLPLTAAPLEAGECLPAPAQGALAIECREDDADALAVTRLVNDEPSHRRVRAERAFLRRLGGGCLAPVGALCSITAVGALELTGMLADPVQRRVLRTSDRGAYGQPEQLGSGLAESLLASGGDALLEAIDSVRRRRAGPDER